MMSGSKVKEESGGSGQASEEREERVIRSSKQFEEMLKETSYSLDTEKILHHLEKFLFSIKQEEEAYVANEVTIKYCGNKATRDMNLLISAGTKALDALLFCILHGDGSSQRIFNLIAISEVTPLVVAQNITRGKKALQAALALVFIQGVLPPNSDSDDRPVPKLLNSYLYSGKLNSLVEIGKDLSVASTRKFPAHLFLKVDIAILPTPLFARCKFSIAGNKAVRYAWYAASCTRESEKKPIGSDDIMCSSNQRLKQAIEITDYLRSLAGNIKAQLRMHPLSKDRPKMKKLLAKLTRAVIESLTSSGREELAAKIDRENNNAFKKDVNLYGELKDNVRVWPVLEDDEADFSDISLDVLKGMYKTE